MARSISADRLRDVIDAGEEFALVDTRDAESFEAWHIDGAIQYEYKPAHEFDGDDFRAETGLDGDTPIVTICAKGISSDDFADELEAIGYDDVRVVAGGMEAWSAVYDHVDLDVPGLEVVQVQRRAKGCLGYIVGDPSSDVAAAVDVTRHTEQFTACAEERGYDIVRVFDTHVHADHISGGRELADRLDVPYHLGANATDRGVNCEYDALDRNETVPVGSVDVKALFTPGHTSEMVSYLFDDRAVCTADTLFVDGVGRTELQFGDAEAAEGAQALYDSLHGTLLAEPDSVMVLPGHASGSLHGEAVTATIGEVRQGLSVLQREREAFVSSLTDTLPEKPPNYETVIAINTGREGANDDEALQLELGPNNCAAAGDD
ncbi:MBL fold metallo-hydrolase [Halorarius litoreus]|uniref:MBL fold metallo-hydrolase n=1 Tax=Halorarius litoreus TaxID=2962676 RepID=UPI0020CF61BC|nr:rhodanese-like domain-containing protein [Halorarius litoreus]